MDDVPVPWHQHISKQIQKAWRLPITISQQRVFLPPLLDWHHQLRQFTYLFCRLLIVLVNYSLWCINHPLPQTPPPIDHVTKVFCLRLINALVQTNGRNMEILTRRSFIFGSFSQWTQLTLITWLITICVYSMESWNSYTSASLGNFKYRSRCMAL